ncbi:dystroglycan 1 isoform X3 [Cydia fagiglandana]|uniref:dystroglycan 1 isoform X3 n=1 Tax=Cydia fagiglandana TaxID=1458189 RepID=UPI002FEE2594
MSGAREMGGARFVACALLLLCPLALTRHDEDFAFDNSEEFQVELTANHSEIAKNGLKRLWGVPDTSAYVGHLFRMEIPKQAFTGDVLAYKVHSEDGRRTPSWLAVDSRHGLISGVPQPQDLGPHTFTVTAHGRTRGLSATDSFTIEVKKSEEKPHSRYGSCVGSENRLVLAVLVDGAFQNISPRQRIRALMELASFMALDWDEFWIEPYKPETARTQSVLMSGAGSASRRHGDATTAISLNVGCGEKLWSRHKVLVAGLREQSRDGTLAHLLRLPVIGWRLTAVKPVPRLKRQSPQDLDDGSGAGYDNYDDEEDAGDYSGYDDADDDDIYKDVDPPAGPEMLEPKVKITPYGAETASEASIVSYSAVPATNSRTFDHDHVIIVPGDDATTTEAETESVTPSERSSTIFGRTTETVTFPIPVTKKPPSLKHHMKKVATAAGKAFRYVIPANLFTDPEDDNNLTYSMYMKEGTKLGKNSWIQFLPSKLEVYALPLEAHVSRWNFVIEAQDSEGRTAQGPLDITVQQHKAARTINHQFVMHFKLNKTFTYDLDWQIRALEGIVNLLATDMHHITVLNVSQSGDVCEFVWTNDTLPKETACPMDDIKRLMQIMETSPESHLPSQRLLDVMSPELTVLDVAWRGAGRCAGAGLAPTPATRAPDTYPPVTRNQVDMLRATVGHLLLYKVPEDTFFDPEDGGTRNLALSLRYQDRSELPAPHWLQFDARNQEFYGLPSAADVGTVHYQLIAEDSSKKSAYDSLIVEVMKAPAIKPTVEFQMTLDYDFDQLAHSANNKRKIVEKLAALFGDKDTSNIRIRNITDHPHASTTIIWYNTSLPMDSCPKDKIETLRKMIIADDGALKDIVDTVFDKEKVMSITLIPLGLCGDQNTKIVKPPPPPPPGGSPTLHAGKPGAAAEAGYTEYLVTFVIPAVVIVCMLLVAGIIACVLYRRRRTGKMSVGDEEERQAFRSKGIPVIFQDELDERGDAEPVHKSPVIMREEKPPLLPPAPDYRGDDAPYRPPPPFAASRTPPRPKATPTYRKPPPYVPP